MSTADGSLIEANTCLSMHGKLVNLHFMMCEVSKRAAHREMRLAGPASGKSAFTEVSRCG